MTVRKEFSDGTNWVELREVDDLRDGDRKRINAAITLTIDPDGNRNLKGTYQDDMRTAMYRLIITNWSFPEPLPSKTVKGLDNLTLKQGRELREMTKEYFEALAEDTVDLEDEESDPTGDSAS